MQYRHSKRERNANPMRSLRTPRVVIVGAGVGGLAASLELASNGLDVVVLERAASPGGKMRQIVLNGRPIDSGPTVLTMRWVFEQLFDDVGENLERCVTLRPAEILARHAWENGEQLDLFAQAHRSADAIRVFAGDDEAARFRSFCDRARATYTTLEESFIKARQPTPLSLTLSAGIKGLSDLWRISPFTTLWNALGGYFHDPRLRQLFGRYATYCGSSPFDASATLMLVSHVEQEGVWLVDGGMHQLAVALESCAKKKGADFRYECDVREILVEQGVTRGVVLATGDRLAADLVLVNADAAAVATGLFGSDVAVAVPRMVPASRSLSAITFSMLARTQGFPLIRHNVFFSSDYREEFDEIFGAKRLPTTPTIYVCAQDRGADSRPSSGGGVESERLFCLINAPAIGDTRSLPTEEIERCRDRLFELLQNRGLKLEPSIMATTTPRNFHRLYPGTGGALYGQASHGWNASFTRPTARTKIPGLYLAGGSTHPGPGVPMAALSGRLAAATILEDLTSARRSPIAGTSGGMSMG
jgi:1-hydroxycarotenoid 3,4-desaturase